MDETLKNDVEEVKELMQEVIDDRGVPRNIRAAIQDGLDKISAKELESINVSSAIYALDDISNDINMPSHTRTSLWEIISLLESVKERVK